MEEIKNRLEYLEKHIIQLQLEITRLNDRLVTVEVVAGWTK